MCITLGVVCITFLVLLLSVDNFVHNLWISRLVMHNLASFVWITFSENGLSIESYPQVIHTFSGALCITFIIVWKLWGHMLRDLPSLRYIVKTKLSTYPHALLLLLYK